MSTEYICEDGDYLAVDERDVYYIGWYLADDGDFGQYVGEHEPPTPSDKDEWEAKIAYDAIKPYADGTDCRGFYFGTKRKAFHALYAANRALNKDVPWPEWATKAKAEGWKPPKGWKP